MTSEGPSLLELLLVHLERSEFKVLFAILFLADGSEEFETEFDLERYSSPGWEDSTAWAELLRRGMRFMALEKGYRFRFLEVWDNGSITRRGDEIEPRNARYLAGLVSNQVSYLDALYTALHFCERGLLNMEPTMFREAIDYVQQAIEHQEGTMDPEKMQAFVDYQDEALASLDIVRKETVH